MKALLIAGYIPNQAEKSFSLSPYQGELLIDWQISRLRRLGHEITVVLGGPGADYVLRASRYLEDCELVYDTNEEPMKLMTYIRSGLAVVKGHALVLPIEHPCPEPKIWNQVLRHFYIAGGNSVHMVRPFRPENGVMVGGFPLLITFRGKNFILYNESIKDLDHLSLLVAKAPVLSNQITSKVEDNHERLLQWQKLIPKL